MGNCVVGGGYFFVLCDKFIMIEGFGFYFVGLVLVKSVIG